VDNDHIFITEKVWKPIIAGQVFVVHSWKGYLKHLQSLGFKTFGEHIDESYDSCENQKERMDKIVKLCLDLKKMDYTKLYKDTKHIREHNSKHFFESKYLSKSVNVTVLNFLEFFDSGEILSAES
jgi:hypothetical protein